MRPEPNLLAPAPRDSPPVAPGCDPVPVTLLTGTNDTMAPMALAHEAAQATPRGQVVPLEGLGHYALVEDPIACARAVAGHWARRSGQQRKGSRE